MQGEIHTISNLAVVGSINIPRGKYMLIRNQGVFISQEDAEDIVKMTPEEAGKFLGKLKNIYEK